MKKLDARSWGRMIGQKIKTTNGIFKLIGINTNGEYDELVTNNVNSCRQFHYAGDCKPILRDIDDMTHEEKNEFCKHFELERNNISGFTQFGFLDNGFNVYYRVWHLDWLESKGMDIRGWIDEELAVDAKEVKQ